VLFTLISGCGYQFQGSGTSLPDDVRRIWIAPVKNNSTEQGVGQQLTEALRLRFERYGVVRTVDEPSEADAILRARIDSISTSVRDVAGDTDTALELELIMRVSGELKRRTGHTLWRNPYVESRTSFASVSNVVVVSSSDFAQGSIGSTELSSLSTREVSRGQQEQALQNLVDETARRVYLGAVAERF
jgi:outer membrane lipopolysaccharide assembly protein LptE/RlpB